jgi:putative FmdB family regulatory protein
MPLYDFHCDQCDEVFEVRASIKDKEAGLDPECPRCHSHAAKQLVTAGLVIRRGDGAGLSLPVCGPNAGPGCCGT